MYRTKVAVGFVAPLTGAIGGPPASEKWFTEKSSAIMDKLSKMFSEIEFITYDIKKPSDVNEFLKKGNECTGYLIFVLNSITALARPILHSSKPTIVIAETYGGAGDYLLEYAKAQNAKMPVIGTVTRDICNEEILKKVKLLEVIQKLRDSRVLFIVAPSEKYLMELEYPLSVDLYSIVNSLQSSTGITPLFLDIRKFVENYYSKADEGDARAIADEWIKSAERNLEKDTEEIIRSAKLYLAMKKATMDYRANAIALNCIVLHSLGFLNAWPCLGYMEMQNNNIVPVCEADPSSSIILLIMKYLANRPGFIADPSPDDLSGEIIYYHCYAPLKPHGQCSEASSYVITPAHLGTKHASVYVRLPVGETITAVGLVPDEGTLVMHTAKTISNEFSEHACSVKLVGRTNTRLLAKNWRWRSGWHRVVFYGNWKEDLKDLATLLKLRVVEEDKGA